MVVLAVLVLVVVVGLILRVDAGAGFSSLLIVRQEVGLICQSWGGHMS